MNNFDESQKFAFILAVIVYLIGVFLIEKYKANMGTRKKYAEIALLIILMLIVLMGNAVSGKL